MSALKNSDPARVNILRYILSKIQTQEINTQKTLTEDEEMNILRKIARELKESLDAAEKAGRQELINQAKSELEIVTSYLPKELSDDDLKKEVTRIIAENQELYNKNPKAIMGVCIKQLKSKADSSRIIAVINSLGK